MPGPTVEVHGALATGAAIPAICPALTALLPMTLPPAAIVYTPGATSTKANQPPSSEVCTRSALPAASRSSTRVFAVVVPFTRPVVGEAFQGIVATGGVAPANAGD